MMKTTTLMLAAMLYLSTPLLAQDKMANNIDNSNIALQGYSPVSYLDLGLAQRGVKDYKSTFEDVTYYFTSSAQKDAFDKNPERYLPQYGGYCAFGVYAGAKFRVDPNKFIVEDDKYFLFLYNLELDAQQLWITENDHSRLVKKANENWEVLHKSYN
ncbi:MAG: YHS domain-containing (seleno)protein [Bacteroidota bacterium]